MATYNNLITEEFVKETRTDGAVTSLTIKVAAYARPAETSYTGNGNYLTHDDATWKIKTITGKDYYDYDSCTALASETCTYTLPVSQQTSITQDLNSPVSNLAEQIEYRNKRALWYEGYMANAAHTTCFEELYTAVEAL